MILFFHFFCLLAQYIVTSISKSISKTDKRKQSNFADSNFSEISVNLNSVENRAVYEDGTLKFFPPVYLQRYEAVASVLKEAARKRKIRKIVDFGCAELGFFLYLKKLEGVDEILEVDVNCEILERYSFKAAPLTSDYLTKKWSRPLDVYILAGNIADYDCHLNHADAVIGIELIEHLLEDDFEKMPYNVFGQIKPFLVIFTTPNADFNSLFPNFVGVRHDDHKFEWTRKQFYDWSQKIIRKYPEYNVKFYGIGPGPEGSENLGCCSQMAVFQRSSNSKEFLRKETAVHNYYQIKHFKYPAFNDTRTVEEKIVNEIQYHIPHLNALPTYYNYEENESEIPLSLLKEYVCDFCNDEEKLRIILMRNGMKTRQKKNSWFLIYNGSEFSSSDENDEDDYFDDGATFIPENYCGATFEDSMDWNKEQISPGYLPDKQPVRNNEKQKPEENIQNIRICNPSTNGDQISAPDETKSAPYSCDEWSERLETPNSLEICCIHEEPGNEFLAKNKIFGKTNLAESCAEDFSKGLNRQCNSSYGRRVCKKMAKSISLDSCLENINCKAYRLDSYHLNLSEGGGGTMPFPNACSLPSNKGKPFRNDSGSSLLSSSLDRAVDSGYPFSFSPADADLTPEQVEELYSEGDVTSRSTSPSSEVDIGAAHLGAVHNPFPEEALVENGDLANNNRDGEGNNVEGLMGQRLVNEVGAQRDPNDNVMFFPELEDFPPWLLHLGDLVFPPLRALVNDYDEDEGVGDDSSSDFN